MFDKVLVTGAAGFIGGHLCRRLDHLGARHIIGIDSLRAGDWSRISGSAEKVTVDIADLSVDDWSQRLIDVDTIFHLAAEKYNSPGSTPERLIATNVSATERLFRAAAKTHVKRIVFASSLYAYGTLGPAAMAEGDSATPKTLYGASKLMGEHILHSLSRDAAISWNCGRLFFIYGPHQYAAGGYKSVILSNFERIISGNSPIIFGDGKQSLDYVYIDDCINALIELSVSSTDGSVVNIASGERVSVGELTSMMIAISGKKLKPVFSAPDWTAGSSRWGKTYLAEEQFGWRVSTRLETGLRQVYKWMLERNNAE